MIIYVIIIKFFSFVAIIKAQASFVNNKVTLSSKLRGKASSLRVSSLSRKKKINRKPSSGKNYEIMML